MNAHRVIVEVLARMLPAPVRERRREEWLADLEGADQLGLARWSIVRGALVMTLTIDRTDPVVSGMSTRQLALRRARWAFAFLGTAVVLGVGLFLFGGYTLRGSSVAASSFAAIAWAVPGLQLAALASVVLGAVALAGAASAGLRGRRTGRVAGIVAGSVFVGVLASLAAAVFVPLLLFMSPLFVVGGAVGFLMLMLTAAGEERAWTSSRLARSRAVRIALAVSFAAATLAVVAIGVLHIVVWNPLAKVPDLSLDEIYARMSAANQGTGVQFIAGWAVFWSLAALALVVLAAIPAPRLASFLTARRIAVLGLLTVGMAVVFQWFAGFSMGMSLADTFMTSGTVAAVSGPLLAISGQLCVIAALFLGFVPRKAPRSV